MFKITIEKNVPIPIKMTEGDWNFPFDAMEIGESFWVPIECIRMNRFICGRLKRGHYKGKKFRCATELKNKLTGCRVWRRL